MVAVIMNHAVIGEGSVISARTVVLEKNRDLASFPCHRFPGKVKKTYEIA
jgi:carbonic anhydrase/acetyltransferase-like protein (isoleucine patch superfamily)